MQPLSTGRYAVKLRKTLLTVAAATMLLAALTTTASARNFSVSNQSLRATFRAVTFEGAFGRIVCPVTVEGSFHQRTNAKVAESLVGLITAAVVGTCAVGGATVLRETLPWHARYTSFTGALPNITSIQAHVIGVAAKVREPAFECLAISTAARPVIGAFNRDVATKALTTAVIAGTIPTNCFGAEGRFEAVPGPLTVLNSSTRITVTLI